MNLGMLMVVVLAAIADWLILIKGGTFLHVLIPNCLLIVLSIGTLSKGGEENVAWLMAIIPIVLVSSIVGYGQGRKKTPKKRG